MTLPAPMAREVSLAVKFAAVCVVGFLADALLLRAGLDLGLGVAPARLISLAIALQVTFALSRWLVFAGVAPGRLWRQWWRFMAANGFGGVCNYGLFVILTRSQSAVLANPWVALVLSSSIAYVVNYAGTRLFVYGRELAAPAKRTPAGADADR